MAKFNLVLPLCFNVFNVSIRLLETNFEALKGAKNHKHTGGEGLVPPKNTAYVQRKIWQRNIDACPPVVVSLIPKERCSSLPGACIKALAIFELQKETKSKTKQIRGVYSNKLSCSHLPIAKEICNTVCFLIFIRVFLFSFIGHI